MQNSTKEKLASQLQMLARKVARARARQSAAPLHEAHGIVQIMQHISDAALTPHEQQKYGDIITGLDQAIAALPTNGQPAEIASICQLLDEIIAYTQKMLATERTKKIVMFLPYKASMWDSLESVWQAAKEQDDVEAIVMPIPYADRNPDGTCAEVHYELHEYPDYVPVVDCRTIDLPSLHPDVIFIHNPYDNCNSVTSVDSAYYSDQLKKCCDLLVYIPYFVTGHTIAPHFCQAPGVVNADLVIVENEDIKAAYEQNYPGGNPPKGKFLALGSPKYDAVLSHKREDYALPEKWQKIVEGKKIVLYNTSLTAMLQNSQYVCRKLRYVFSIFKDRKDVALWWRPHPLMKSTMRSMHPEILTEYEAIEQQYIKEGWGIYDDTPDMDRAIVCSDCYYGDMSSMVRIYQETGKPVMLQEIPDISSDIRPLDLAYVAWDGDEAWFITPSPFSALAHYDRTSNKTEIIGRLPLRNDISSFEYRLLVKVKNKVIIAPCNADSPFIEYKIDENAFQIMKKPCERWDSKGYGNKFMHLFQYGTSIFFTGNGNGLIVEYDCQKDKYEFHYHCYDEVAAQLDFDSDVTLGYSDVQLGYKAYYPFYNDNIIIELDLRNLHTKAYRLPIPYKINSISESNEQFWLTSTENNKIVRWNLKNDYQVIDLPESPIGLPLYMGCEAIGEDIIVLPFFGREIYCLKKDMTCSIVHEYPGNLAMKYMGIQRDNNCIMCFDSQRRELQVIDKDDKFIRRYQFIIQPQERAGLYSQDETMLLENQIIDIASFLEQLNPSKFRMIFEASAGEKIISQVLQ